MLVKFLICLSIPFWAFAGEKVYVPLQEIVFGSDCIWVKSGEDIIRTEELHVDAKGYYIMKKEESWRCSKCGYVNGGSYPGRGCRKCDFPYDYNQ